MKAPLQDDIRAFRNLLRAVAVIGGLAWGIEPLNAVAQVEPPSSSNEEGSVNQGELAQKLSKLNGLTITLVHPRIEPLPAYRASFVVQDVRGQRVKLSIIASKKDGHLKEICISKKCLEIDKVIPKLKHIQKVWLAEPVVRSWYYKSEMRPFFAIYVPFETFLDGNKHCQSPKGQRDRWSRNMEIIIDRQLKSIKLSIRCFGNEIYYTSKKSKDE